MNRLAIVGSRDYPDEEAVIALVNKLKPTTIVVSGGARGVDSVAVLAAMARGLETEVFNADWNKHGKKAGYLRNVELVNSVDGLFAFWDGKSRGTKHAIELARKRGIWLKVVTL